VFQDVPFHHKGAGVTYLQAFVIALIQGVTELFPVSSLGHSVLIPAWFGGSWQTMVTQSSQATSESSFYLAYIVALHCATALALMWYFRADWIRIIRGFVRSLPASVRLSLDQRRPALVVSDKDERLAWMIIFATIPVGLTGVVLEHTFRVVFAKPAAAATLLFVNGLILLGAEAMRRSAVRRGSRRGAVRVAAGGTGHAFAPAGAPGATIASPPWEHAGPPWEGAAPGYPEDPAYNNPASSTPGHDNPGYSTPGYQGHPGAVAQPVTPHLSSGGRDVADVEAAEESDTRLARLSYLDGTLIGAVQILALLAGISRSGVTIAGGLWRGLDHEDAARFAFLLATPVILAAGVLKVPSLFGPAGAHIHGQVVLGVIVCGIAAYLSVRFLIRWFQTRTLTPFAIYCLAFGLLSMLRFL
jgi:undecaprenyl-diphosphatase